MVVERVDIHVHSDVTRYFGNTAGGGEVAFGCNGDNISSEITDKCVNVKVN